MQRRDNEHPNGHADSTVEKMARPPARGGRAPQSTTGVPVHDEPHGESPILAQHERVSAVHAAFLRMQEGVHLEFLEHRRRLLEWLEQATPELTPLTDPRVGELALDRVEETVSPSAPRQETVAAPAIGTTQVVDVTWEHPLLDAYVMPAAAYLSALGRIVARSGESFGHLECDLTCSRGLAVVGEAILSELAITPSPKPGGAGESTFHLSCRVRESGRPLAEATGSYTPMTHETPIPGRGPSPGAAAPAQAAHKWTTKARFTEQDLAAIFGGNILPCFGVGFERSASHTRTPPLPGAALVRITSAAALDPTGGPWSTGALRARAVPEVGDTLPSDDAGTRLARVYQGALQTLAFFVMAGGDTIARDGWRFETPDGAPCHLHFTAAPALAAPLEFELSVERFDGGPWSTVVGDVKAFCGDKLVFYGQNLALKLTPDFPLTSDRGLQADGIAERALGRPSAAIDGFHLDYASMLAGAVGRPTDAFDQAGAFFETGERQMPRLPGPPYHFVTRVTKVQGERLSMRPGAEATMEYDVPRDAWYFDENGNRSMPWCVLLEVALQPCGWLSVYVGCPLVTKENVFFRNLDGAGKMTGEVFPDSGTIRTHTKVTSVSSVSGIILVAYKIECHVGDREVANMTAGFGYFPNAALDAQAGLKTSDEQRARLAKESAEVFDFAQRPEKYFAGPLRLPGPMLLMIDRVTGYWRGDGKAGKGWLRAEKKVKAADWFFKSHFYSDPVQPGTLGLEMMLQTLQFYVIEEGLHEGLEGAYFEPLVLDSHVTWKYRGQVRPENKEIVVDLEIVSVERELASGDSESRDGSVTVLADTSLWVDGVRVYEAKNFGIRVRGNRQVRALPPRVVESVLDPAIDKWVTDHRPSCTVPVMPMTGMVELLAGAALAHARGAYVPGPGAPDWVVVGGREIRNYTWLIGDRPKRLRTEAMAVSARAVHRTDEVEVMTTLYDLGGGGEAAPRRIASGRMRLARRWPSPPPAWAPLEDGVEMTASPYESRSSFWGPRLQLLRRWSFSRRGLSADLDAAGADAPIGTIHPILLDGALHGIPHEELERWSDKISPGHMGVPVRLTAQFFGPTPKKGIVRAEVRFAGFDGANVFPTYVIQMIDPSGRVWAVLRHVEMLIPFGDRGLTKANRIPFLVQRLFQEGAGLSEFHSDRTELRASEVKRFDGLPGSVAHVYGLERDAVIDSRVIAVKDHVGQRARVHPDRVEVDLGRSEAWCIEQPDKIFKVTVEERGDDVVVRDA